MLEIEYDHRSLKGIMEYPSDFQTMLKVVEIIKQNVPANCRIYNPDTKIWYIPESYMNFVRERTSHLDVTWLKRI